MQCFASKVDNRGIELKEDRKGVTEAREGCVREKGSRSVGRVKYFYLIRWWGKQGDLRFIEAE